MGTRLRKDVWKLKPLVPGDEWDPTLEWYARAVRQMQTRPLDDPASWRYQAAMHEYVRERDPLANDGDSLPTAANQEKFWNQCQHFSWFFLPWHRLYLGYFEQIVEETIKALVGPLPWSLPYWNYSDAGNDKAGRLPLAFTLPTMKDGSPNPLRVKERLGNDNSLVVSADAADVSKCLKASKFQAPAVAGLAGFGGPKTGFNHDAGSSMGRIDQTPHGSVHGAVGGFPGGFMGAFNTAALDPIFWLHHANIDRLWVVWRTRDPAHVDPVAAAWLTGVSFTFHDAAGNVVTHTASEAVDTTVPLLDYTYESTADPLGGAAIAPAVIGGTAMASEEPEMVGASDAPLIVKGDRATTTVRLNAPTGPAALRAAASPPDVHLTIENVTGLDAYGNYAVYLNLPDGAKPEEHRERYVGLIPMFGVREATRRQRNHAGDGVTFSLDATSVVRRLEGRGEWTGSVAVTLVRDNPPQLPATAAAAEGEPIRIGRVGVYFT